MAMSHLRQQLQQARQAYQSLRYPGDLVADVRRTRTARPVRWIIGLSALAALILISVMIYSRLSLISEPNGSVVKSESAGHSQAQVTTSADASENLTFEFAPPSAPEGISFVPSFATLEISSSIGIPAWDATTTTTTSPTTKESL